MMNMNETNDMKAVAQELTKWADEEMHFKCMTHTDNSKLSSDLIPACKGSAMINLWSEITGRVKTKKAVKNIRDNISLQRLIEDKMETASQVENQEIELEALEREVEILELQMKKSKQSLQNVNLRLADNRETSKLNQIKSCMLRRNAEALKSFESGFSSFQKWFEELLNNYCEHSEADVGKMLHTSANNRCYQEIQTVCSYLAEKIAGTITRPTESDNIKCSVGNLMASYSPDALVSCLQRLTETTSAEIKEEERSINFEEDLEEIERKLRPNEDGNETRVSALQKMLRLWDLECVESYTDSLVSNRNAENTIGQCEDVREAIIGSLEKMYEGNPSTLQLALDDLESGLSLASVKGCLESFLLSYTSLQEDFERKTIERKHLAILKEKTDSFSAYLEANEKEIISLAKHNSSVKSKLIKEQDRVHSGAIETICKHGGDVSKACLELQNSLHEHKNALGQANLENLQVVELERDGYKSVKELSINRFGKISNNVGGSAYQRSLNSVNIVNHLVPSSCLIRIVHIKAETNELSSGENELERRSGEAEYQRLSALAQKAINVEKQQLETHGAYFESGLRLVQNSEERSESFGRTIQTWYDQPGQYQTPWLLSEGFSLVDWKEKVKNT